MNKKLGIELGAVDKTKSAFDSAGRSADGLSKKLKDLASLGLGPDGSLKGIGKLTSSLKNMFQKITEEKNKFSKAGAGTKRGGGGKGDDVLGFGQAAFVGSREDLALAQKIREMAKRGQADQDKGTEAFKKKMKESGKDTAKMKTDTMVMAKNFKEIARLKFDNIRGGLLSGRPGQLALPPPPGAGRSGQLITQDGKGNILSVLSGGTGGGGGALVPSSARPPSIFSRIGKGNELEIPQAGRTKTSQIMSKVSDAAKSLPVAGAVIAMAAGAYAIMENMGLQYRQAAGEQIPALQLLGKSARGPGTSGGVFRNVLGMDRARLMREGIDPSVYAGMMGEYSRNVMGRTGGDISGMEQEVYQMQRFSNAFGIPGNQIAQYGGVMERFKTPGGIGGRQALMRAAGAAETVGMGGARMGEFMDNLSQAVTTGVYSGSRVSTENLTKSLFSLSNTKDERIKALAPQILQSSMQMFGRAAQLEGGTGEGFAFQAIREQLRAQKGGADPSLYEVRQRLASGDPIENMKAMVDWSKTLYPDNEEMSQFFLQKTGMFGNITDPGTMQKVMDTISASTSLDKSVTGKQLEELGVKTTNDRLTELGDSFDVTIGRQVSDKLNMLDNINKTFADGTAKVVDVLRDIKSALTGSKGSKATESTEPTGSTVTE